MGAAPPSQESKVSNTTHRQTMMGATIVHGGEDEWSRDEDVEMEDVVQDSSSALFQELWLTCKIRLMVNIVVRETAP
jgi:hypothetical protein